MGSAWWLVPLGFVIGTYGTLIGAGGGFILAPVLALLYPADSPETLTSISLAVVFFNALSGSAAYARLGRIDYRSGGVFAVATIPGAILGALATSFLPRRLFDGVLGALLLVASIVLLVGGHRRTAASSGRLASTATRTLVEADGTRHVYAYNQPLGVGLSLIVGFLSSLLGIGGGIIHVPALAYLLHFPVHVATATSHFVLVIMALVGTVVHIATGAFAHGVRRTTALAFGVLIGAQLGARASSRVHGAWIIRGLAIALGFIGARVLLQALFSR
jgi:uncharacterized membrane protein YfcA